MRGWLVVLGLAGCGRIGFDAAIATDDAPGPDAAMDLAAILPCEVDRYAVANMPDTDELRLVFSGGVPMVVAVHHITTMLHEVHRYRLDVQETSIVGTELGVIYTRMEITGFAVEPAGTGFMMMLSDPSDVSTHVVELDANLVPQADNVVDQFASGIPIFATSTAGRMLTGTTAANAVMVRALDPSFAPIGSSVTVATGADRSSIAAAGGDFIVGWETGAASCRFARIDLAGSILAGPWPVNPGGTCVSPAALVLPSGRVVYLVHAYNTTTMTYTAFAGTMDASLTSATTPAQLGATYSFAAQLVVAGDRARIPLYNNGSVRIAEVDAAGMVFQVGADFGAIADYDAVQLEQVGGASILLRAEAGRLVLRELCR